MVCERRNRIKCDNNKHCDLEEILHSQELEALYMEIMVSSDEAIESILQDLEAFE